jgi:hypothetical protein
MNRCTQNISAPEEKENRGKLGEGGRYNLLVYIPIMNIQITGYKEMQELDSK